MATIKGFKKVEFITDYGNYKKGMLSEVPQHTYDYLTRSGKVKDYKAPAKTDTTEKAKK